MHNCLSLFITTNKVLHNALVVTHAEILEVSFCFSLKVMWSKVVLQLCNKVRVVVKPGKTFARGQ